MPRVVHFEIHSDDPERCARFYREVLGWEITRWGTNDYWLVKTGEKSEPGIDGGIFLRRGPRPAEGQPVNAYVCTVGVPDLDARLEKAIAAGAKAAVPKVAIPGVGWLAYVHDTEGNLLGLMQNDPSAK